jgi:anti-sigma factor RsiW
MNGDLQLKLQAWVDGELAGDEARRVESMVAADPDAASLVSELRMTRSVLAGNEPQREVPASREFYWSRIRHEIERGERGERGEPGKAQGTPAPAGLASLWNAFRRGLVPISGLALVVLVAALSVRYFGPASLEDAVEMIEVENLSEKMSSMSYRSHADKMFVVYVYSKDQPASEEDASSESLDDLLFQ